MYLPGFFTGNLINRFGVERIMLSGLVLLVIAGSIASFGIELSRFAVAMGVLGLGWNLSFVGATTLLTQCYRPSERGMVQGFNELVVFGFVALAALMAGPIIKYSGWSGINITLIPFVLASIALVVWLYVRDKKISGLTTS